jgi:hypothetical protein
LAAQEFADENQEEKLIHGRRIVVDFGYGSPTRPESFFGSRQPDPMQEGAGRKHDQLHGHIYHRRVGSLLRTLIEYPTFGNSDLIVDIEGRGEAPARNVFQPLESATHHFSGYFRGYWGVISDAKLAPDNSLWLNSGGNDNISFCLDSQFVDVIIKRYGIEDLEDIAGAYILVFGTPRVSQNGKLFCVVEDINLMALRLT